MTATPEGPVHGEISGRIAFDEFVVDTVSRTLLQGGTPVPLNSKAFDSLLLLVSNRPADTTGPAPVIGTGRPIRVAYPTARASERASFSVAPEESWLVYSQEDYSSRDIMLLSRVP